MTQEQEILVHELRVKLIRNGYPSIFIVSLAELEAAEQSITEWKMTNGFDPVLMCGEYGLYFKNCQLVLEMKES